MRERFSAFDVLQPILALVEVHEERIVAQLVPYLFDAIEFPSKRSLWVLPYKETFLRHLVANGI